MIAIETHQLTKRFGENTALNGINLEINSGEFFGIIGPNGGGKSTTFRILSTLLLPTSGTARILDLDIVRQADDVRRHLGVVFQSPAVDKKLTVRENLTHQGHLYGLVGSPLRNRIDDLLAWLDLDARSTDLIGTLSGGLQRRVEIAKCLLHEPKIILLDEPTTGLDPLVRSEIWRYLRKLNVEKKVTILVTTHLLDEADDCDRIALIHKGVIVANGKPEALKRELGGDIVSIHTRQPQQTKNIIESHFGTPVIALGNRVKLEKENAHLWMPELVTKLGEEIESFTIGKPTLADLFMKKTGYSLNQETGPS